MTSDEMEGLITTYLEMRAPPRDQSAVSDRKFKIRELKKCDWTFNRDMYFRVGEQWAWIDRRPWTEQQWREYTSDPNLRTFAGYYEDEIAGYFELLCSSYRGQRFEVSGQTNQSEIEIAYFGLLPDFIGRGLGSALLTGAIDHAWLWSPTPSRVWVHTCNRDHSNALANYQARGFAIYKIETGVAGRATDSA